MFYRFLSKLATQERLEAFPVPLAGCDPMKDRSAWMPFARDYEVKFKQITLPVSILGVTCFRAPLFLDSGPRGFRLRFHRCEEALRVPDIWGVEGRLIVSEKFRKVVESVDEMEHEYIPIDFIDRQEKLIATAQPYYWFNQRRYLTIQPGSRIAAHDELGFCPIVGEEDFLARVLDTENLRDQIEKLPIWQHYGVKLKDSQTRKSQARCVLYMGQRLVDALREVHVTGADIYSQKYGIDEESLCKI